MLLGWVSFFLFGSFYTLSASVLHTCIFTHTDVLLLGKTGKAIRPTNSNSGVSAVASVTLKKLVEPLKVVNMDDNEYSLMKEIVLFNPGRWFLVSCDLGHVTHCMVSCDVM